MLKIKCDSCGNELKEPGALLFSPPCGAQCIKIHICRSCWENISVLLTNGGFDNNSE